MKVTRVKIVIVIAVIQICSLYIIYRDVIQPPASTKNEKIDYSYKTEQFHKEFVENKELFKKKHLNKTIVLTGVVTTVQDSLIVLNNKISCISNLGFTNILKNEAIKVKGRYVGYDELFDNLIMSECLVESL